MLKKNLVARVVAVLFLVAVLCAPLSVSAQPALNATQGVNLWLQDGAYWFSFQWFSYFLAGSKEGAGMDPDGAPAEAEAGTGTGDDVASPSVTPDPRGTHTKEGVEMDPNG